MNAIGLGVLSTVLICGAPETPAQGDLPPAANEVLKQFDQEIAEIEKNTAESTKKFLGLMIVELKKVQDACCREAKLDEAVAVRDLIRAIRDGNIAPPPTADLPAAAREVFKQHNEDLADIQKKADAEIKKRQEKMVTELKKVQDSFCKEAKLDEAVAVRDMIRVIQGGPTAALPDPGYVNNLATDIGKVFYYQVVGVGADAGQAIYGSDVYTTGSHLGMAAVHCGLLKPGQKGIVKVTILRGQDNYVASTRRGVTSIAYGNWGVSFKVERVYGFVAKLPEPARLPEQKPAAPAPQIDSLPSFRDHR
jgi:hypothetical protein